MASKDVPPNTEEARRSAQILTTAARAINDVREEYCEPGEHVQGIMLSVSVGFSDHKEGISMAQCLLAPDGMPGQMTLEILQDAITAIKGRMDNAVNEPHLVRMFTCEGDDDIKPQGVG